MDELRTRRAGSSGEEAGHEIASNFRAGSPEIEESISSVLRTEGVMNELEDSVSFTARNEDLMKDQGDSFSFEPQSEDAIMEQEASVSFQPRNEQENSASYVLRNEDLMKLVLARLSANPRDLRSFALVNKTWLRLARGIPGLRLTCTSLAMLERAAECFPNVEFLTLSFPVHPHHYDPELLSSRHVARCDHLYGGDRVEGEASRKKRAGAAVKPLAPRVLILTCRWSVFSPEPHQDGAEAVSTDQRQNGLEALSNDFQGQNGAEASSNDRQNGAETLSDDHPGQSDAESVRHDHQRQNDADAESHGHHGQNGAPASSHGQQRPDGAEASSVDHEGQNGAESVSHDQRPYDAEAANRYQPRQNGSEALSDYHPREGHDQADQGQQQADRQARQHSEQPDPSPAPSESSPALSDSSPALSESSPLALESSRLCHPIQRSSCRLWACLSLDQLQHLHLHQLPVTSAGPFSCLLERPLLCEPRLLGLTLSGIFRPGPCPSRVPWTSLGSSVIPTACASSPNLQQALSDVVLYRAEPHLTLERRTMAWLNSILLAWCSHLHVLRVHHCPYFDDLHLTCLKAGRARGRAGEAANSGVASEGVRREGGGASGDVASGESGQGRAAPGDGTSLSAMADRQWLGCIEPFLGYPEVEDGRMVHLEGLFNSLSDDSLESFIQSLDSLSHLHVLTPTPMRRALTTALASHAATLVSLAIHAIPALGLFELLQPCTALKSLDLSMAIGMSAMDSTPAYTRLGRVIADLPALEHLSIGYRHDMVQPPFHELLQVVMDDSVPYLMRALTASLAQAREQSGKGGLMSLALNLPAHMFPEAGEFFEKLPAACPNLRCLLIDLNLRTIRVQSDGPVWEILAPFPSRNRGQTLRPGYVLRPTPRAPPPPPSKARWALWSRGIQRSSRREQDGSEAVSGSGESTGGVQTTSSGSQRARGQQQGSSMAARSGSVCSGAVHSKSCAQASAGQIKTKLTRVTQLGPLEDYSYIMPRQLSLSPLIAAGTCWVEGLSLQGLPIMDRHLASMLKAFGPGLQWIDMRGTWQVMSARALARCTHLKLALLAGCQAVTPRLLALLCSAAPCLEHLSVSGDAMGRRGLRSIANCRNLQRLDLGTCCKMSGSELAPIAERCAGLRLLTACKCLGEAGDLEPLRALERGGCEIALWNCSQYNPMCMAGLRKTAHAISAGLSWLSLSCLRP